MQSKATTVTEYIDQLPEDRKQAMTELRNVILKNIPKGFKEVIASGMIGYIVPHSKYPPGYHCNPDQPLCFMNIASQKNFIAVYHMGMYCNKKFLDWFTAEYPKHSNLKLDMGKSCIRFKKINQIPYKLIGELAAKITPEQWIEMYEKALNTRSTD